MADTTIALPGQTQAVISISPKITTAEGAVGELKNFIKDPPRTPMAIVQTFSRLLNVTGAVKNLVKDIPGLSMVSSLLSLVDAFSGAPSFEDMALEGINDLKNQLAEGIQEVKDEIAIQTEAARVATIDAILSGVDELALEESAVSVMESLTDSLLLEEQAAEFAAARDEFLQVIEAERAQVITDLQEKMSLLSQEVEAVYNEYLSQIVDMISELAPYLLDTFNAFIDSQNGAPAPAAAPAMRSYAVEAGISAPIVQAAAQPASGNNTLIYFAIGGMVLFLMMRKKS